MRRCAGERYECFVRPDTTIPFMVMPDGVDALLTLAAAPRRALTRTEYNLRAFNPSAAEIRDVVLRACPEASITFNVDDKRQAIIDTWPADVDDSAARTDWGFNPMYDFDRAFHEYLMPTIRRRYRWPMTDRIVTAFAPATVSNVACGFDVLGFALEAPGDEVTARFAPPAERASAASAVTIDAITGDAGRLPREADRNTAGVAAQALLTALGERRGVALSIAKGLPLASGLGGSAASAAAAVVAVDALLDAHAPLDLLIACAIEGEGLGARSAHPDNIAPALCGGFVLVRHPDPPDIVRLPVPAGLMAVVVHPDLEIETAKARALLGTTVPLADAIRQWANLGALVDGLHRGGLRAHLARARRHDRRTAPGVARPRPRGRSSRRRSMRARSGAACRDRGRRCSRCAGGPTRPGAWRTR